MATATSIQFWNVTLKSVKRSASQVPKSAAYRLDTGDQMEALGLEEGFSIGEEEELRSGHASRQNYNLARSPALRREIMDASTA